IAEIREKPVLLPRVVSGRRATLPRPPPMVWARPDGSVRSRQFDSRGRNHIIDRSERWTRRVLAYRDSIDPADPHGPGGWRGIGAMAGAAGIRGARSRVPAHGPDRAGGTDLARGAAGRRPQEGSGGHPCDRPRGPARRRPLASGAQAPAG